MKAPMLMPRSPTAPPITVTQGAPRTRTGAPCPSSSASLAAGTASAEPGNERQASARRHAAGGTASASSFFQCQRLFFCFLSRYQRRPLPPQVSRQGTAGPTVTRLCALHNHLHFNLVALLPHHPRLLAPPPPHLLPRCSVATPPPPPPRPTPQACSSASTSMSNCASTFRLQLPFRLASASLHRAAPASVLPRC